MIYVWKACNTNRLILRWSSWIRKAFSIGPIGQSQRSKHSDKAYTQFSFFEGWINFQDNSVVPDARSFIKQHRHSFYNHVKPLLLFTHRNSLCNVFNTIRLYKIHFWEIIDKSYFSEININISNICLEHSSWLCFIFFSPLKLEKKTENEMVHFLKSTIPDHILHNTSGEYLLIYVSLLQSPYFLWSCFAIEAHH